MIVSTFKMRDRDSMDMNILDKLTHNFCFSNKNVEFKINSIDYRLDGKVR